MLIRKVTIRNAPLFKMSESTCSPFSVNTNSCVSYVPLNLNFIKDYFYLKDFVWFCEKGIDYAA